MQFPIGLRQQSLISTAGTEKSSRFEGTFPEKSSVEVELEVEVEKEEEEDGDQDE